MGDRWFEVSAERVADGAARRPAYREVADEVRVDILAGRLPVGQRLPTEAELSQRYGVGRSTVREALRVLSSEGLIATTRGSAGGSIVVPYDREVAMRALEQSISLLVRSNGCTLDELFEARELLEVPAARLAAIRRRPEDLTDLRASVDGGPDAKPTKEFASNKDFHALICRAAGNRLVQLMSQPIYTVVETGFSQRAANRAFWQRVRDDHAAIFMAIRSEQPVEAEAAMREHLMHLRSQFEAAGGLG